MQFELNNLKNLDKVVTNVVQLLIKKNISVATAESFTGGLISQLITSVSGASAIFQYGFAVYSVEAKCKILDIPHNFFEKYDVVSEKTAHRMATSLKLKTKADICIATTGYAQGGGISLNGKEIPDGTCFGYVKHDDFTVDGKKSCCLKQCENFTRDENRKYMAYQIFSKLLEIVPKFQRL